MSCFSMTEIRDESKHKARKDSTKYLVQFSYFEEDKTKAQMFKWLA